MAADEVLFPTLQKKKPRICAFGTNSGMLAPSGIREEHAVVRMEGLGNLRLAELMRT